MDTPLISITGKLRLWTEAEFEFSIFLEQLNLNIQMVSGTKHLIIQNKSSTEQSLNLQFLKVGKN